MTSDLEEDKSRLERIKYLLVGKGLVHCVILWLLVVILALLINGLTDLLPKEFVNASYGETRSELFAVPLWKGILLYCALTPLLEETIFRIGLFGMGRDLLVKAGVKRWKAVTVFLLISALVFALYHGNLVQGNYAFWMGLVLGLGFEATGALLSNIPAHQLANLVIYLLAYAPGLYKTLTAPAFLVFYAVLGIGGCAYFIHMEGKVCKNG